MKLVEDCERREKRDGDGDTDLGDGVVALHLLPAPLLPVLCSRCGYQVIPIKQFRLQLQGVSQISPHLVYEQFYPVSSFSEKIFAESALIASSEMQHITESS